ncbi:hypothetical protein [Fluviicola sp.]|uniref:hypothetical protein n=1 Tax=Fluviicola sp. TaxID=1917219 RepID=UPI0031D211C9
MPVTASKLQLNNIDFLVRLFTQYQVLVPALIVSVSFFFSCTKEKTPTPVISQPTKWEKIAGHYKAYDTTGVYLYDMDLVHIHNDATNRTSCFQVIFFDLNREKQSKLV